MDGGDRAWEALQEAYNIEDISLETLVDDWDRLVVEEQRLEGQAGDRSDLEAAERVDNLHGIPPLHTAEPQPLGAHIEWHIDNGNMPVAAPERQPTPRRVDAPSTNAAAYMDSLNLQSGLHVVTEAKVARTYHDHGEYGLFSLFFTAAFRQSLQTWTANVLEARGKAKLTESEFNTYCGLELAMSICPLNEISEYWSESRFVGQPAFIETIPRTHFQNIRAALQFHAPGDQTLDKIHDPLWHSRTMLAHFQKRFTEFAVPTGVSSIDEMTVRTKARSRARTYMQSKPNKYGVRFYAVVGWDSLYVHSVWDNSSGNTQRTTPAQRYTQLFPMLRTSLHNILGREAVAISNKSASALWLAMVGHQSKTLRSPTGYRLMVFYTRHTFAKAILAFTDGEMHSIGTVRINLVDKWNKGAVEASVRRVANAERGACELVAAVDPEEGWMKKEADHHKRQKNQPKAKQTAYQPVLTFADRAGYIVYKDRKVVIFYSNDLQSTPSARILPRTSAEAVECYGLYPIQRWTEDRVLHRKIFMAPTVLAVYNRFMNGVDQVDQLRSTNPTKRREKRLDMTLFTWLLDIATINAFALLKRTSSTTPILREFKRRIADSLTRNEKAIRRQNSRRKKRQRETLEEVVGSDSSLHIITPNSTKHSNGKLTCYLCSLRGIAKKSRYGCTKCERGFHVECFSAFHYQDVFRGRSPVLRDALDAICRAETDDPVTFTRKRANKSITSVEELTLPSA